MFASCGIASQLRHSGWPRLGCLALTKIYLQFFPQTSLHPAAAAPQPLPPRPAVAPILSAHHSPLAFSTLWTVSVVFNPFGQHGTGSSQENRRGHLDGSTDDKAQGTFPATKRPIDHPAVGKQTGRLAYGAFTEWSAR
ncbi:unnamed protein product [[Candida] boidinii]|nr:unnamed protein product [[Candida] boidinii]